MYSGCFGILVDHKYTVALLNHLGPDFHFRLAKDLGVQTLLLNSRSEKVTGKIMFVHGNDELTGIRELFSYDFEKDTFNYNVNRPLKIVSGKRGGMLSMSNSKISTLLFPVKDENELLLGTITGDELNQQLRLMGFEIKEID